MENRFGFKDFVLLVLLTALLVSVWLAIKAFDRQWDDVKALKSQVGQLTGEQSQLRNELAEMRTALKSGVRLQPGAAPGSAAAAGGEHDPFQRLRQARSMPSFAQGDWLIDAFGANVAKITPHVYKDLYGRRVQEYVFEGLITVDPVTLEIEPHIAESWKISDDGLTITFKMRENVVFSDGKPMTSEDVVFSYELLVNPRLDNAAERQFYDNIASCTAKGKYEVTFKMKEPHYMALSMAGGRPILPKHFYSRFTVDEINKSTGLLLGSGPYRAPDPTGWAPGKLIELVRNERYWGPQPGPDRLVWREVTNDVARLTMFRNREVDLFSATPEQYVDLLKDKEVVARSHTLEYDTVPTGYNFIAWNQKRGGKPTKFADKRVRRAMTMLIDRPRICQEIWLGYATPAIGPWPRGSRQADSSLEPLPYDVTQAWALLKEAGWEDRNSDGVLENASGEMFRFKFTYPSGSKVYDRTALFLKDSLQKAGVLLELDPLEWSVFSDRAENQDFEAITMFWGGGAVESDIRQMFHSSQTNKGGDNFMSYTNPELDKVIDAARRTMDDKKRMELWRQANRILHEDQPYTFMLTRKSLALIDKRIENIQLITQGLNDRYEWFVPVGKQRWGK